MERKTTDEVDSMLEALTGFKIKQFLLIILIAYLSILTMPWAIITIGMATQPVAPIIVVMLIQYFLLHKVGQMHGKSILKTMTQNGFVGWLMWFALVCMLMLPVIHLVKIFGFI